MSPLEAGFGEAGATAGATPQAAFSTRHIGLNQHDVTTMLSTLGITSVPELLDEVIPANIRRSDQMKIGAPLSEAEVLDEMRAIAGRNQIVTSMIGMGYYDCHTPPVILRNVLENPAWYTAYTPYQPEISQGRLEAILNFQTMVLELTGMDIANGSLLDEATAAAEGMAMAFRANRAKASIFRVDPDTHPQTIAVLRTRAEPIGIELEIRPTSEPYGEGCFGAFISYPASGGEVRDIKPEIEAVQAAGGLAIVASDLLALTMIESPGALGADMVLGSAQRFGVPFGYGGPHAAFFGCRTAHQRSIPGRLVGVSQDSGGRMAYRLALQTREQHIRREKATSNICTNSGLCALAFSVHMTLLGEKGLRNMATENHRLACLAADRLDKVPGAKVLNESFFNEFTLLIEGDARKIVRELTSKDILAGVALGRLFPGNDALGKGLLVAVTETTTEEDIETLASKLKKLQANKFKKKIAGLIGGQAGGTEWLSRKPAQRRPAFSSPEFVEERYDRQSEAPLPDLVIPDEYTIYLAFSKRRNAYKAKWCKSDNLKQRLEALRDEEPDTQILSRFKIARHEQAREITKQLNEQNGLFLYQYFITG